MIDLAVDRMAHNKHSASTEFLMVARDANGARYVDELEENCINLGYSHGGLCLERFSEQAMSSVDIFVMIAPDDEGLSNVDDLVCALDYCIANDVGMISLSMGTTDYRDAAKLSEAVERIVQAGGILIAGASNKRRLSFPACLPGCIGVCLDTTHMSGSMHEPGLDTGRFSYSEDSADGIEVIVSPVKRDYSYLQSNSEATAHLVGYIFREVLAGMPAYPDLTSQRLTAMERVRSSLAAKSARFDLRHTYKYAYDSIFDDYNEDVLVVAVQGLQTDPAEFYGGELQRLFQEDDYFCVAVYPGGYSTPALGSGRLYCFAKPEFLRCSYGEYIDLIVRMCQPNVLLFDFCGSNADGIEHDIVLLSDNNLTCMSEDVLQMSMAEHTPDEVFALIVSRYSE